VACSGESQVELISQAKAALLSSGGSGSGGFRSSGGSASTGGTMGSGGNSAGGTGGTACTDDCGAQDPNVDWANAGLGCPRGCFNCPAQPPQAALDGAQAGALAGAAACAAGVAGAVCGGGVIWAGGWGPGIGSFCIEAAAWASFQACASVHVQACAAGVIGVVNGQCVLKNAVCLWAEADACAWAQAYAFAFACVGGRWR
jgi:hypothetical protein